MTTTECVVNDKPEEEKMPGGMPGGAAVCYIAALIAVVLGYGDRLRIGEPGPGLTSPS